jgi:Fe-S cluster assembly scaffold protein SufB
MNKIEVISKEKILNNMDNVSVSVSYDKLIIKANGRCDNTIVLTNGIYSNVTIILEEDASINFLEIKDTCEVNNCNYQYILGNNSKAIINKFYHLNDYYENTTINLGGYNSKVTFNLSVMSFGNQKYDINVNHNSKKTISNIFNHGSTFASGTINFNVNGIVKKGMSDSVLNQDNRIMTLGEGRSEIMPNLFIEENMVEARHGATIGRFNEEELFYLQTRGIPIKEGYELLLKGFLLGNLQVDEINFEKIEKIIEKLGR